MDRFKTLTICFFKTKTGQEPVKKWFGGLSPDIAELIYRDILAASYWNTDKTDRQQIAMKIEPGLWQVHNPLFNMHIIFTVNEEEIILLDGFAKPAGKALDKYLNTARKRLKQYMEAAQ